MPNSRWSRVLPLVIGLGIPFFGEIASAFQGVAPLSDNINTRQIYSPEAWAQPGFTSRGPINQSPADLGPVAGMPPRTPDGDPSSGDRFPVMQPGSLPGGFSQDGFNSSGMIPPVNQPDRIAKNPVFGGGSNNPTGSNNFAGPNAQGAMPGYGQSQFGQNRMEPNRYGQSGPRDSYSQGRGPNTDPRLGRSGSGTGAFNGRTPNGANRFAQNSHKPRVHTAIPTAQKSVVALIGQVAKPGSYNIGQQTLTVGELIEKVGGFANQASGQLRVIRNGRPGQSLTASGAAYYELLPGDLVIADELASSASDQFSQEAGKNPNDPSPAAQSNGSVKTVSNSAVQIGFVNLAEHPVVLKLRGEHASINGILSLMRQDPALAQYVRVVMASTERFQRQPHPDMPLPSQTVLIFPPNAIRPDRIAALPEPMPLDPNGPSRSNESPQPGSDRAQPLTPGLNFGDAANGMAQDAPTPPNEGLPFANFGDAAVKAGHDVAANDIPEAPEMSSNGLAEPPRIAASGNHQAIASKSISGIDNLVDPDSAEETPTASRSNVIPVLIIGACLISLLGLSLWLRRRTQTNSVAPVTTPKRRPSLQISESDFSKSDFAEPMTQRPQGFESPAAVRKPIAATVAATTTTTAKRELLESLIQNQVPVVEERVKLASPMHFHGRPAAPRMVRIDGEHEIPKPHVAATVAPDRVRTERPAVATATARATATTSNNSVRVDRASKPVTSSIGRSPLDRALSNVQSREER